MSLPAVIFDGNTLSLPEQPTRFRHRPRGTRVQHTSQGGQTERLFRFHRDEIQVELTSYVDESFRNELEAFWSWASRGEEFGFALDNADKIDTTLAAGISKGATSLTVTSATGIVADQFYRLRNASGGENLEIVEVFSVAAPTVNLKVGTKFAYVTADIFRSRYFYPNMIIPENVRRFFSRL